MSRTSKLSVATLLAVLVVAAAGIAAWATETPDSLVNPLTGDIEIADPVWSGTSRDVHFVIDPSDGGDPIVEVVADHALDDIRPQIAADDETNVWITWWRDSVFDQVLVRKRNAADDSWGAERRVGELDENSKNPVLTHDGSQTWVAFQVELGSETGIAVGLIIDEPDPIGIRLILGQTDYSGDCELTIDSQDDKLWITWLDSSSAVAWVEYDPAAESWSLPAYESYAGDTSLDARDRIRTAVVGAP